MSIKTKTHLLFKKQDTFDNRFRLALIIYKNQTKRFVMYDYSFENTASNIINKLSLQNILYSNICY